MKVLVGIKKVYVLAALRFLALYNWLNRNNSIGIWKRKKYSLVNVYLKDVARLDRDLLIDKIIGFNPESALEVGCFVGVNLHLLARKNPNMKLCGIDPNLMAVERGNEWMKQEGHPQVLLLHESSEGLYKFADKSFDVVFTRAVLLHIGDKDIQEALRNMLRIARKGLVFLEWQDFTGRLKDKDEGWLEGHWTRRYDRIIKKIMPGAEVRITELKHDVWKEWNDHGGAYIEVIK